MDMNLFSVDLEISEWASELTNKGSDVLNQSEQNKVSKQASEQVVDKQMAKYSMCWFEILFYSL